MFNEEEFDMQCGDHNLLDMFQEFTPETWVEQPDFRDDLGHATNGLFAEAGEIAAAYQKFYRGDYDEEELHKRLKGEIGGLMYYLAQVCNTEGIRLSNVLLENKNTLLSRKERGTIQGDGDVR